MKKEVLTKEVKTKIICLYSVERSVQDISKETGVSERAVLNTLLRHIIRQSNFKHTPPDPETIKHMFVE